MTEYCEGQNHGPPSSVPAWLHSVEAHHDHDSLLTVEYITLPEEVCALC